MCSSHGIPSQPLFSVINFSIAHFVSVHVAFLNIVLRPYLEGNTFISCGAGEAIECFNLCRGVSDCVYLRHISPWSLARSLGLLRLASRSPGGWDGAGIPSYRRGKVHLEDRPRCVSPELPIS